MLDLKLKDIPETVYKAIKALDNIKFGFLTIHGQGGRSMIESAKKAVNEIESKPKPVSIQLSVEMQMLLEHLRDTKQTIFEFFRSIDLDDSGNVDSVEFKDALISAEIDLPDWDLQNLVDGLDLNADGQISPTELHLAFLEAGAAQAGDD